MVMAEYATRSRTPIRVGYYDVIRTIGRGNFAVVKLARHQITKTEVAIKIIDKLRLDQVNLKKIYREIQILKLLNHQHIIKLYQVMETSSTIYLVCEYARNGELFDYITEQGRLPEDKARKMFWQVLTAVEYCHKNNVVHRDLKAENLLLDSNNNIKLADFGFSNFFQSGNMLSTWCGSPPYAAPEVFEGKAYEGTQLDVWSLGVVLYVLVCGTFPFDGTNLATLKERVLGGRFRIPYWMSQDCENLVRRMLVTTPKKRLTISQIKKHKWMQEHGPTLALSHTKSSPHPPRRGRLSEYNEHVLKVMQGFGLNQQKTIESLQLSAYDHQYAIYHLLVDRLKMHRTSFPLDISYESGRRRPSNVADQALANMAHIVPHSGAFSPSSYPEHGNRITQETIPDVQFDDMTTGLPTVHRTLPNPVRYSSPPTPKITTCLYEDGTPPNLTSPLCQSIVQPSENVPNLMHVQQTSHRFPSSNYRRQNTDTGDVKLGNYNLQQRRHTLMVPNPSQMQMLRAAMSTNGQGLTRLSPHSSTVKLSKSGNEMSTHQGLDMTVEDVMSGITSLEQRSPSEENTITSCNGIQNDHMGLNYAKRGSNALLQPKSLHLPQKFTFDQQKGDARPLALMQRRSGLSPLVCNAASPTPQVSNEGALQDEEQQYSRIPATLKQRHLNTSPIGFREGRRASDGLLLLGDNLLKEHLQKLARAKAVPEMTVEDSEESWKSEGQSNNSNQLQVPHQVNRCSSGERMVAQQTSPVTTPVGSGGNICFQPYSNSQSLARRRSLQVHQLHTRANLSPKPEVDMCAGKENQHLKVTGQTSPYQDPAEPMFFQDPDSPGFHWSSWKPVHGTKAEDNSESNSSMWQQLGVIRSGMTWNHEESPLISLTTMSVASDEAVPSTAAAAMQQQQRESMTKPIRQQSLPITPTSTNHPFGTAHSQHNPSLAQALQQRRLQRRIKVATHQQQQNSGYQVPLPELEQLRIDNSEIFPHFQKFGTQNLEHLPSARCASLNEHEGSLNWVNQGLSYATAVHTEEVRDGPDVSEEMLPIPSQFPVQEMLAFENHQSYLRSHKFAGQTAYHLTPPSIGVDEKFVNAELTWMCESASVYENALTFDTQISTEKLSNSAELNYGTSETMEFALY